MPRRARARRAGRRATTRAAALLCCAALLLVGCDRDGGEQVAPVAADVRVATGPEAESRLLALVAAGLAERSGLTVDVVELADARAARRALELRDVDVVPSYTGEAWLEVYSRADPPANQATSLARVREDDAERGLVWLSPPVPSGTGTGGDPTRPPADATFAFVVSGRGPTADVVDLTGLARLLARDPSPTLCVDGGFAERPDGLVAVLDAYSIAPDQVEVLDLPPADAVAGVAVGACVAGLTTATDGTVWQAGLRPLADDLGVFPAFVVTLVATEAVLDEHAGLRDALRPLVDGLTTARLGGWNQRVAGGEVPAVVAADVVEELAAPDEQA